MTDKDKEVVSGSAVEEREAAKEPRNNLSWILGGLLLVAIAVIVWFLLSDKPLGQAGDSEPVAKVNGETITKGDLYDLMYTSVGEQAREQAIRDTLLDQEAEKAGITVTEEEITAAIDERIATVRAQFPSDEEFQAYLAQQNVTLDAIKNDLRRGIPTELKIRKILEPQIDLSDEKIANHFVEYKLRYSEAIRASHILVDTEEKANQLLEQLKNGADFAELAKEHGTDATKSAGGDLNYFGKGRMVPEFEEAAFALGLNEISGVVQTEHGYHIIKVTEIPKNWTLEEKKEEVKEDLLNKELEAKMATWLQEVQEQADIEKF